MYLTDIRGFTAEDYFICNIADCDISMCDGGSPILCSKAKPMCKITIHGMGMRGDKGFSLHFARFCIDQKIEPQFISLSDMGIAFFIEAQEKDGVLDALCECFPMWE